MYYEEEFINGVLMWRNTPNGKWSVANIEKVQQRIIRELKVIKLKDEIAELKFQIRENHLSYENKIREFTSKVSLSIKESV